jgi:hypothetical protein
LDESTRQTYGLLVQDKRTTTQKKKKRKKTRGGGEGEGQGGGGFNNRNKERRRRKKGQKTSTDKITSADLGWVRSWHKLESTEAGIDAKKQEAWKNRQKKKRIFY